MKVVYVNIKEDLKNYGVKRAKNEERFELIFIWCLGWSRRRHRRPEEPNQLKKEAVNGQLGLESLF